MQDQRVGKVYDFADGFNGYLTFKKEFIVDGDLLKGFAQIKNGPMVYARYRLDSEQEKEFFQTLPPSTELLVIGQFEQPAEPPHIYSFNMSSYLRHHGASSVLAIQSIKAFQIHESGFGKLLAQRRNLKRHISERFPEGLQAEAEALLIGHRGSMTPEDQRIQQTLGISHLFAISGLHVGIVSGLLYFILVRSGLRKETATLVLLLLLPIYAVLAGAAPSVLRAVSMATVVLACRLVKIRLPVAHIFFLSFIAFILLDPYVIFKIGFQLSYGASGGIIYSLRFLSASTSWVKIGFLITFISQFTLYPILLFHFYEVSLSAFLLNSFFVPLYTLVILPANFLLLALTFLSQPAADFVFGFYEPFRDFIAHWTKWLSSWPVHMWTPGKPETWMLVLLIGSVILFYSEAEKGFKYRQLLIPVIPALGLSLLPYVDPDLKVTFLDVGQGDSALIELPYRQAVYLVDAGGVLRFDTEEFRKRERPFEIGRQVVSPYLKGRGISRIDKLILSHPDADHVEGADEILELFEVHEIHLTPGSGREGAMNELNPYLKDAAVYFPGRGSGWQQGDSKFSYLSPADPEYGGNNDSLVMLMEHSDFKVLFTGDLEVAGEEDLVSFYGDTLDEMTILKVGHHGSKTSSGERFLETLNPRISIISAGRDNRYGHPAAEVMERFDQLQLPTLNTADVGTIEIIYRKGEFSVQAMRP
ncbi:MAG TPA: DNA internalization-related competence protein ComEC/Rec2 [Planococcus sp. (in: firmicutes)]|nr:DNA internalization-related competence protein ComEC/Rec2 [Planococcus sp. (in: firmicutes)]